MIKFLPLTEFDADHMAPSLALAAGVDVLFEFAGHMVHGVTTGEMESDCLPVVRVLHVLSGPFFEGGMRLAILPSAIMRTNPRDRYCVN